MKGLYVLLAVLGTACGGTDASSASARPGAVRIGNAFLATPVAKFQEPWAMTFLPDGRLASEILLDRRRVLQIGSSSPSSSFFGVFTRGLTR
jgi:hypothetical protein